MKCCTLIDTRQLYNIYSVFYKIFKILDIIDILKNAEGLC